MRQPLRLGLYLDTLHDKGVKVEPSRLHDLLVSLEDEDDGDGAFGENFGRVKRLRQGD